MMSDDMMTEDQTIDVEQRLSAIRQLRPYLIEVALGFGLAAMLLWAVIAAGGEIPFVYQGL